MCGIAGSFHKTEQTDQLLHLECAAKKMSHRGPNDSGVEIFESSSGVLGLAQTRLSIIDLSPGGHQPMHSADGRFVIVFNGEIYNYRELREELREAGVSFKTDSDTEVLLACWVHWKEGCLNKLRGMFAFTVWDKHEETLSCVRDAFGIKPFYYFADDEMFAFASEVPATLELLPKMPELNWQRAYDYLLQGRYDDQRETFFTDVYHILPGHLLTVDLKTLNPPEIIRWWWPDIRERSDLSFDEAAEKLRGMFLENIKLHLRSDVPLGAALSGGLDSSATVCAIRHLEPNMPIHTFSFIAQGEASEEVWVDKINAYVGAEAHKVVVEPEELAADLDDMIFAQGEPFGSTSIYAQYRVFKLARDCGITVTLDGQGADELLAGYFGYPDRRLRSLFDEGKIISMFRFLNEWSRWPGRSKKTAWAVFISSFVPGFLWNTALKVVGRDPSPDWLNYKVMKERKVKTSRFGRERIVDLRKRRLVAILRFCLCGNGLACLLRHGDRDSMRWSIESRVPFLTTDMAEFLLSLPEEYLLSAKGETKSVFRAAMRGIVPDEILDRRDKIGFETPEHDWLNQLGDTIFNWLVAAEDIPFLNAEECNTMVRSVLKKKQRFNWQAWRMINFCRWYQLMYKGESVS